MKRNSLRQGTIFLLRWFQKPRTCRGWGKCSIQFWLLWPVNLILKDYYKSVLCAYVSVYIYACSCGVCISLHELIQCYVHKSAHDVCMYVYEFMYYKHIHTKLCACMYIHMLYACIDINFCTCMCVLYSHVMSIHLCMFVYTWACSCMYVCVCAFTHAWNSTSLMIALSAAAP